MKSIRARLGLLFILFFLLIAVSVGATLWSLQAQAQDALVINLAGRQRMLVQLMTRLAAETQASDGMNEALSESVESFEAVLHAFQTGGQVLYPSDTQVVLPPVREPEVQQQLQQVEKTWKPYKVEIERLLSPSVTSAEASSALVVLRQNSTGLVSEADHTVRLLQEASRRRVLRILVVQAGFFAAALILLGAGSLFVHGDILTPLKKLERSAERIRSGDLSTHITGEGPTEILYLTDSFESMRAELEDSHRELAAWAQTLEEKVKGRTQELEALYTVSREISARLDWKEVVSSVTAKASELLKTEVAFLCLLNSKGNTLELQGITGPEETVRQLTSPADNPFVQAVLGQPCDLPCRTGGCPGTCGILDERYKTSHLAAPLTVENRVIGALCVGDRRPKVFSEDDPALLTRLAGAAAVAIENAHLYEQAERVAALEERQRIAAAMHDGLAQILDALGLQLEQAADLLDTGASEHAGQILTGARGNLRQASNEVRRSIASLDEEPLRPRSIQEQLRELVQQQALEMGQKIDWRIEIDGCHIIPQEDARQMLGIAQEAIANARRHSGARRITVRLAQRGEEVALTIEDDGCGFDPAAPHSDGRQHFGLKIQAARAAQLGGQVGVDSAPGKGTCITLTWPLRKQLIPVGSNRKEPL